jgi:hypothetical protein
MPVPIKIIGFKLQLLSSYDINSPNCKKCNKSLYLPINNNSKVIIDEHKDGFHESCIKKIE